MGLSGREMNEENHIVNGSWIAWLIDDSIGAILSVRFCPYYFVIEPSITPQAQLRLEAVVSKHKVYM